MSDSPTNQNQADVGSIAGNVANAIPESRSESEGGDIALGNMVRAPFQAAAMGSQVAKAAVQLINFLFMVTLQAFLAPMEVWLRVRVGERHINAGKLFYSMVLFILLGQFSLLGLGPGAMGFFFGVLLTGMIYQSIWIYFRNKKNQHWHSYYDGDPIFTIGKMGEALSKAGVSPNFQKLVIEPIMLFMISGFLGQAIPFEVSRRGEPTQFVGLYYLSNYLFFAAFVSVVNQLIGQSLQRQKILDEKDAKVMMQAKQEAERNPPAKGIRNFCGVTVPSAKVAQSWTR